jgi:hypothetical protein
MKTNDGFTLLGYTNNRFSGRAEHPSGENNMFKHHKLLGFCLTLAVLFLWTSSAFADAFVPPGLRMGDPYHLVFTTRDNRKALTVEISEYNDFVQAQAALNPSVTGTDTGVTYRAIASTDDVAARDNALVSAPVYLVIDGTLLAKGFDDFWDGSLFKPINRDQFGTKESKNRPFVATGSNPDGSASDKPLGGFGQFSTAGISTEADTNWITAGRERQIVSLPLYALSEELTSPEDTIITEPFSFEDFSDVSDWTLNGDAIAVNNGIQDVLRLTRSVTQLKGSAFLSEPVFLPDEGSFSARFQFQITDPVAQGADGFVFTLQSSSRSEGGTGGGLGFQGIPRSVGIEFDTFPNSEVDPDGNHIGINLDGDVNSVVVASVDEPWNDGTVYTVWVDYNGATDLLEARFSSEGIRPAAAAVSYSVDLPAIWDELDPFVGFTAGTGDAANTHEILNFTFNMGDNLEICECDLNQDGACDWKDLLEFFPDWGRTDCNEPEVEPCECDLNNDGACDGQDWLEFFPDWGRTDCPIQ